MLTVIVLNPDQYLNKTLESLDNQTNKDFKIIVSERDIEVPKGFNNQINTIVKQTNSDYYAVLTSGCLPWSDWVNNILWFSHYDYLVGPVHLISKNYQPKYFSVPESIKYGNCLSIDNANYNNFAFKKDAFDKHGGFNANEDTLKYFINQFSGDYKCYNFVDKIIVFNTPEKNDYYRLNTSRTGEMVKWTPVYDKVNKIKSNLVITLASGNEAKEILYYTEESHFKYAKKINADYIQLTGVTQDWWGLEKFRVKEISKIYDRILFLDCDVLIKEDSPNIFEEVPNGYIGCVNDWSGNGDGTLKTNYWLRQEAKEMCYYQGVDYIPSEIYNSGVVVFNGNQSNIWEPPTKPFTYFHCTEQHWVEQNIRRNNYPVHILDNKWNLQYWRRDYNELEESAYFIHPAGEVDKLGFLYKKFNKNKSFVQDGEITSIKYKKIPFKKVKDYGIITVCSDNYKLLAETSTSHINYANKTNADYHIITENINPHWGMGNKYLIKNFAEQYKKILYIDSDVFIKDNSPNIFELTPDDQISIHNESFELNDIEYRKSIQKIHNYICEFLKFDSDKVFSLNCGVMVIPNSVAFLYSPPEGEFPAYWCFDQHYLLCMLRKYKMDYFEIGEKFNWEYIRENWESGLKDVWFIHLNGIKSETKRLELIKKI